MKNIYTTAIVSPSALLGKNISIGPFTIIHDNVSIGDNSVIGSHCVIGHPSKLTEEDYLNIGKDSHFRSHSVFHDGSSFGP